MSRNSSGVYTLPPPNPVVPFTVITSVWANATMNDIAQALTDSLDRTGRGGMLAPFRVADGTPALPGFAFSNEASLGIYRPSAGILSVVAGGNVAVNFASDHTEIKSPLGISCVPHTWGGGVSAIELGNGGSVVNLLHGSVQINSNLYWNGTNWSYINSFAGSLLIQDNGDLAWYRAPIGTAGAAAIPIIQLGIDANGIQLSTGFHEKIRFVSNTGATLVPLSVNDRLILADPTTLNVNLTLPAANAAGAGFSATITVQAVQYAGANVITVFPNGTDQINNGTGGNVVRLGSSYNRTFTSNGVNQWYAPPGL